jgi:two-component system, cell cycle sensor histidine kinase and response regulator CckA
MQKMIEDLWFWVMQGQQLELHESIYRLLCLLVAAVCLVVILPLNFWQNLPIVVNVLDLGLGIFSYCLFRLSLRGRNYPALYFITAVLLLDLAFFPNAGSIGSIPYYYFTAAVVPLALFRGRRRWLMVGFLEINLCGFLLLDYFYPSMSTPFSSGADRLIDLLSGAFCASFATVSIFWIVLKSYTRQHRLVEEVSRRLSDSEKNYRELVESANIAILRADRSGTIHFFNKLAESLFGYSRNEVLGGNLLETLFCDSSGIRTETFESARKMLEDPVHHPKVELETFCRDGSRLWISWVNQPICSEGNEVFEILCLGEDISEKKHLEERRLQQEQQLIRIQRLESLGFLAGGIAHDFNNILTAVLGNASLMKSGFISGSMEHQLLGEVEKASLQARELTLQLLTFAKGGEPVRAPIAVDRVIADSASLALRGHNTRHEIHREVGCRTIFADAAQMGQVFSNLLINARQAMPDGGNVNINIRNRTLGPGEETILPAGDYVEIQVKDTGNGIAENDLNRIFDPYFTTKPSGSGLGLAVAFSIIKRHGGHISAESRKGEGACFTIVLPASTEPDRQVPSGPLSAGPETGKILIVDDEEMVRSTASQILIRAGHQVEEACEGAAALQMYSNALSSGQPYHAVILDLTIVDGMGGKETIRRLLDLHPGARVIVSSGYSSDPIMSEHKKHGFSAILMKPYGSEELREVVRKVICSRPS